MTDPIPYNPVGWFEIYVDDMERAKQFYATVLSAQMRDMPDPNGGGLLMVTFPMNPEKPNASGALVKMNGLSAGGNSTIVYFSSEDCSIEESRVEEAGGKIMKPKISIGDYGFMSLCIDTEGNTFGLHSMK